MPTLQSWLLPPPESATEFEDLTLDLFRLRYPPVVEPNRYGRNGQAQHGVDFVLERPDGVHGYQSKRTTTLTAAVVADEVAKTSTFVIPLQSFTVLTAAPLDTTVQGQVLALSASRVAEGLCPVTVVFWPTLKGMLAEYPEVLEKFYPQLEVDPSVLLDAQNRRIGRELPGTYLEFHHTPGSTNITLHPGPGGVQGTIKFDGPEAVERFQAAARAGEVAEFSSDEMTLGLPDVLRIGRRALGARTTFRIEPHFNRKTARVRLVVRPRERHRNQQDFVRRAGRGTDGYPALLSIENHGTERFVTRVQVDDLPLEFTFTRVLENGDWIDSCEFTRAYGRSTVESAAAAERLVAVIDAEAWVGLFNKKEAIMTFLSDAGCMALPWLAEALETLEELVSLTTWDIDFPMEFSTAEVPELVSLTALFREGRRVLGESGSVNVVIDSEEHRAAFLRLCTQGVPPFTATIEQPARQISLLGQEFQMPATRLCLTPTIVPDECIAAVKAGSPPIDVRVEVPSGGSMVEELVAPPVLDAE